MVKALAGNLIDAMRGQPLALALLAVNVFWLIGLGYGLREVSQSIERRDQVIASLAHCADK